MTREFEYTTEVSVDAAPNHWPHFFADDGVLPVGVRALSQLAVDYTQQAR